MAEEQSDGELLAAMAAAIDALDKDDLQRTVGEIVKIDPDQLAPENLNRVGQGVGRMAEIPGRGGIVYKGGPMMTSSL
jgi:hypothetical protein